MAIIDIRHDGLLLHSRHTTATNFAIKAITVNTRTESRLPILSEDDNCLEMTATRRRRQGALKITRYFCIYMPGKDVQR